MKFLLFSLVAVGVLVLAGVGIGLGLSELGVDRGDVRDWAIILYCLMGLFAFTALAALAIGLLAAVMALKGAVQDLMDESIKPTLTSVREAAASVKGTTEFVGQTAVAPIIRTYGMFSGARKGLGVLTGLSRRRKG